MDDLLLSEVQVIVKNREQTKNIRWDYIGTYTSEKRRIIKISVKKKKEKKNEKYRTQRMEKDWIKSRKRRYAGISIGHFLQAMNKAVTFIQTKV